MGVKLLMLFNVAFLLLVARKLFMPDVYTSNSAVISH